MSRYYNRSQLNSKALQNIIDIEKIFTHSVNGEYKYSGANITIPSGCIAIISYKAHWRSYKPIGAALSNSDTELDDETIESKTEGQYPVTNTYIVKAKKDMTLYVWTKYGSTGIEACSIRGIIFN